MTVAGLILAAGESRRMGYPKALLSFHGATFLDHLTGLLAPYCSPLVVVLGSAADQVRGGIEHPARARFVVNPDPSRGQLSSMQCGLSAIGSAGRVLFALVDHPNINPATVEALLAASGPIAIPRYRGRRGHPVVFSGTLIPEFLAATDSAKEVIARHAVSDVDVEDAGILDDIDDPETYRKVVA